jgi:phosphoribosylpyrophosphate synthetase
LAIKYLIKKNLTRPVIVSPDIGGFNRAIEFKKVLESKGVVCDLISVARLGTRRLGDLVDYRGSQH